MGPHTIRSELNRLAPSTWGALIACHHEHESAGFLEVETSIARVAGTVKQLLGADSCTAIFSAQVAKNDSLVGDWRPVWMHSPERPGMVKMLRPLMRTRWRNALGKSTTDCGQYRSVITSVEQAEGAEHAISALLGPAHRAIGAAPISRHVECSLAFTREDADAPFSAQDADRALGAAYVFSGIMRRWARQLGVLDSGVLLTPRERQVLHCLLQGMSEKEGAATLDIKASSFHQVAVAIYKKLQVQSRGELISKCLQNAPAQPRSWRSSTLAFGAVDDSEASGPIAI